MARWVQSAQQARTGDSQVIFFSDTTTGHWLSHAPMPVTYVDIGAWAHDHCCSAAGPRGRRGAARQAAWRCSAGSVDRPPSPTSLLVHGLKRGGFDFAFEQTAARTAAHPPPYDHQRCVADVW